MLVHRMNRFNVAECRSNARRIIGLIGLMAATTLAAPPPRPPATQPANAVDNPQVWQPRTKSVAVFKNGLGFFMREGETALRDGWCTAQAVPPAAFGTLAFYSNTEGQIVDVVGSGPGEAVDFDDRDAPKSTAEKKERLEACKNMKIALTYSHKGTTSTASGKLVSVSPEFVILENEQHNFAVGARRNHPASDPGVAAAHPRGRFGRQAAGQGRSWHGLPASRHHLDPGVHVQDHR